MKALKLKAAMKNPDEFYFAMHRKKTEGGVHVLDGSETLPHDVAQVWHDMTRGGERTCPRNAHACACVWACVRGLIVCAW